MCLNALFLDLSPYVESFSSGQVPARSATAYPAASVPNEQPGATRIGHRKRPGSVTGIRPIFPATSLIRRRALVERCRSRSIMGIAVRSRSRRLRRRVRDHPPSACGFRSGGHEARERSAKRTERERGREANQQTQEGEQLSQQEEEKLTRAPSSRNGQSRRRRRRDQGTYRVSERDVELLGLIAEQYAVTLDQLARLIGRSYRTAASATAGATPAGRKAPSSRSTCPRSSG